MAEVGKKNMAKKDNSNKQVKLPNKKLNVHNMNYIDLSLFSILYFKQLTSIYESFFLVVSFWLHFFFFGIKAGWINKQLIFI